MARAPRVLLASCTAALSLAAGSLIIAGPAAATPPSPYGRISTSFQYRTGAITVTGWAYDRTHPSSSITVCLAVAGTCVRAVRAASPSPNFDRSHHITGAHAFRTQLARQRPGVRLVLQSSPATAAVRLDSELVATPGSRVITVARRYVRRTPYVYGGSTPRGFDCSGYAMYSYHHGRVANLPHNSNAQRFAAHMHRITRAKALPGDLVFYFSGRSAYHVAIYAGHGRQYSASDPRDGIQYQRIWAKNIQFGTNWH